MAQFIDVQVSTDTVRLHNRTPSLKVDRSSVLQRAIESQESMFSSSKTVRLQTVLPITKLMQSDIHSARAGVQQESERALQCYRSSAEGERAADHL